MIVEVKSTEFRRRRIIEIGQILPTHEAVALTVVRMVILLESVPKRVKKVLRVIVVVGMLEAERDIGEEGIEVVASVEVGVM